MPADGPDKVLTNPTLILSAALAQALRPRHRALTINWEAIFLVFMENSEGFLKKKTGHVEFAGSGFP
jgi:hypothetical protein